MSTRLMPYPEYKGSGLPWLGRAPAGWETRRAKSIFDCVDIRSDTGEEELLTVSARDGVVPRREKQVTMFKAESYVGHKLCWPGDLVINSLWAWAFGLGFSDHHGIVSSAYGVYRPKPQLREASRYLNYLLRSRAYEWELRVRSKGIWTSRLQLTDESFLDMPVVLPPPQDTGAIVGFLSHFDRRISRLVRAKRRMIQLLHEHKQTIIHRAVTRGLRPNVRLKPSGIEWLGEIPDHWVLKRLKFVAAVGSGQVDPRELPYREYPPVAPNHIEPAMGELLPPQTAADQGADSPKYVVEPSQLVYSKIRPNLRKAAIAPSKCLCSADMYPISPDARELRPRFLMRLLLSAPVTQYLVDCSMRVAMPKVNRVALGDCWLWYPSLSEQDSILSRLGALLAPLEVPASRAHREIGLLREYRARLVADVVTGKLDVREVELPSEEDDDTREDLESDEALGAEEADEVEVEEDADE